MKSSGSGRGVSVTNGNGGGGSSATISPYVILCDAGSTGTRLYVYRIGGDDGDGNDDREHDRERDDGDSSSSNDDGIGSSTAAAAGEVVIRPGPKMTPGLSTFAPSSSSGTADDVTSSVTTYLLPALRSAAEMIPPKFHPTTPLYVYATAGMRLLPDTVQSELYDALYEGLKELSEANPSSEDEGGQGQGLVELDGASVPRFDVQRENFRTIDGEDEGYFAALAVNYLGGRIGSDLRVLPPSASDDASAVNDPASARLVGGKRKKKMRDRADAGHAAASVGGDESSSAVTAAASGSSLLGALDLGGASAQIVFDSNFIADAPVRYRRRLMELALADREGGIPSLSSPSLPPNVEEGDGYILSDRRYEQRRRRRQLQKDGELVALEQRLRRDLRLGGLRGATAAVGSGGGGGGASSSSFGSSSSSSSSSKHRPVTSTAAVARATSTNREVGQRITRDDFFSLSLLGYGGERMRDRVERYVTRHLISSMNHDGNNNDGNRRLDGKKDKSKKSKRKKSKKHKKKKQQYDGHRDSPSDNDEGGFYERSHTSSSSNANGSAKRYKQYVARNPCYPPSYRNIILTQRSPSSPSAAAASSGSSSSPSKIVQVGTGRGSECMRTLDAVMEEQLQRGECQAGEFCPDLLGGIMPPTDETFYAFTLYSYAVDFARAVMDKIKIERAMEGANDDDGNGGGRLTKEERRVAQYLSVDNPTLRSMKESVDLVCSWDHEWLKINLPREDRAPYRCMDFCLGVVLLTKMGFPEDGDRVHFTERINGREAEWTLGAYLHLVNEGRGGREDGRGQHGQQRPTKMLSLLGKKSSSLSSSSSFSYSIQGETEAFYADVTVISVCALILGFCVRCCLLRRRFGSGGSGGGVGVGGGGSPRFCARRRKGGLRVVVKPPASPVTRTLSFLFDAQKGVQ